MDVGVVRDLVDSRSSIQQVSDHVGPPLASRLRQRRTPLQHGAGIQESITGIEDANAASSSAQMFRLRDLHSDQHRAKAGTEPCLDYPLQQKNRW